MANPLRTVVPDWLIVGTLALIGLGLAALAGFAIQQLAFYGDAPKAASPTRTTHASVTPTTPTPTPTKSVEPKRTTTVSVLNATQITGLAARTLDQVVAFGWPRGVSGNWNGTLDATTVFYPAGAEDQAKLLAADLGVSHVEPSLPGMSSRNLVIVITAPARQ